MPEISRVVIVGASLAGLRAAGALRRAKFDGEITLIGAEPHLPYDRPPLSKQILVGKWAPEKAALSAPADFEKQRIDLKLGVRATALDTAGKAVVLEGGERVPYDAIIIATGASPRKLRGTPEGLGGIHTLRTMEDALAIRAAMEQGARVAVVGAGFIGAEVAAAARERGLETTVVEVFSQPLERALGARIGAAAAKVHRDHGVDLRLGVGVAGFEGSGRVERVVLENGDRIAADLVVVGIGVVPETGWLEDSGLTLRDGVVCDATLNAGVPGVYAVGDLCRWYNQLFEQEMRLEHWTNAVEQGMAAARNIVAGPGAARPYAAVPYVWSDQYDLSIQTVGYTAGHDEVAVKHGSLETGELVALYGRQGRLVAAVGFNMPRELNDYRRLIAERATMEAGLAHVIEDDEDE
ncbi:MAG: NAD(P)/FAD-dependent oxidoreductase [Dehalococcoidia bacterium]